MNKAFNSIIVVTMLLCFFALSSNMSANILEQTKEIGVLRSIGFRRFRIMLLYFYEAAVLILASSLLGVMIGMVVGYTMTIQESLILGMDLPYFFPLSQFIVILILTFTCALLATFGPSFKLTKLEIS
jgi:ABC-type antimicrobial peptide transport system permease subunit